MFSIFFFSKDVEVLGGLLKDLLSSHKATGNQMGVSTDPAPVNDKVNRH